MRRPRTPMLTAMHLGARPRLFVLIVAGCAVSAQAVEPAGRTRGALVLGADTFEVEAAFARLDLDSNGWISYREMSAEISIDRAEFRRYDTNADGRVGPREFAVRTADVLARLGVAPAPKASEEPLLDRGGETGATDSEPAPDFPTAADILAVYDRDESGGLVREEIERLFDDLAVRLSARVVGDSLDHDKDATLNAQELDPLARMVRRHASSSGDTASPTAEPSPAPKALDRRTSQGLRPTQAGETPDPGPASPFQRLDLDGDGWIEEGELQTLQFPARTRVRAREVLAALDRNADGLLSRAEFEAALGLAPLPQR